MSCLTPFPVTTVVLLEGGEREEELARMLGGAKLGKSAKKLAGLVKRA